MLLPHGGGNGRKVWRFGGGQGNCQPDQRQNKEVSHKEKNTQMKDIGIEEKCLSAI
jgi:hypothetical protein